jgi:CRISPR-associated protein Csx3
MVSCLHQKAMPGHTPQPGETTLDREQRDAFGKHMERNPMELFPAVLIGGPPNSGKSVLAYNLSQSLRERGVQHYVLRAAPDGEGDWTWEANLDLVRSILIPRTWTPAFVEHVCRSLAGRRLPLIVDVGGRPAEWQEAIFDHCTHAILLTPDDASRSSWLNLIARHGLILLADLRSLLQGTDKVMTRYPILTGTITGLRPDRRTCGPVFAALVERLAGLFAYDATELRYMHLSAAPAETTVDLDRLARSLGVPFVGEKASWEPQHLPAVLNYLPENVPLAVYGRGPNWLYAALALLAYPADFYQFDVRLGWITPPRLSIGSPLAEMPLQATAAEGQTHLSYTVLTFTIPGIYLDYSTAIGTPGRPSLAVPPVSPDQGLVLNGKLPLWLWTALAIAYHDVPWLAVYQPQQGQAVVVASRQAELLPGQVVPAPAIFGHPTR